MRKLLAFISTVVTFFAIREGYHIFTSTEKDIIGQKPILMVIAVSLIVPLIFLSLWLWRPKDKQIN